MTEYLILFAIVLGMNMLPAFGPPTWTIIVLYGLNTDMKLLLMVLVAALAAACGRLLLAYGFRWLRDYIPVKWKKNAEAAGRALQAKKRNVILGLACSPSPRCPRPSSSKRQASPTSACSPSPRLSSPDGWSPTRSTARPRKASRRQASATPSAPA